MKTVLYRMNRIDFFRKFISNDPYDKKGNQELYLSKTINVGDVILIFIDSHENNTNYYGVYAALIVNNGRTNGTKTLSLSLNETPLTNTIDEYINDMSIECINDKKIKYGVFEHKILSIKTIVKNIIEQDPKYKLIPLTTKKDLSDYFNVNEIANLIIRNVNIPEDINTKDYLEELFNNVDFWTDYKNKIDKDYFELVEKTTLRIRKQKKQEDDKKKSILTRVNDDGLNIDNLNNMYFDDYSLIERDVLVFEADITSNKIKSYKGVINNELVISNNFLDDFSAIQKQFNKASKIVSTFCYKELKILMNQGLTLNDNQLLFDLSNQLILHKRINRYDEKLDSTNRNKLIDIMEVLYKVHGKNRLISQDLIRKAMYKEQMEYIKYGDECSLYDKRLDTYLWNEFEEAILYNERMPYDSELNNLLFDKKHFINFSVDLKDKFWMIDENIGKIYFKQFDDLIDDFEADE